MTASVLRQFVQVLLMGEALSLRSTLAEGAVIDDPTLGRVASDDLVRLGALWRDRGAARDPRWVALTEAAGRAVAEFEIDVAGPQGPAPLPVAVVAKTPDSALLARVRLYHSFWPLEGGHRLRGPLVACADAEMPSDVVSRYQDALASGDVDGVLACFGAEAYAREPTGGQWTHRGTEGLRRFYSALFTAGGGIPLKHCTVTDDGTRCALEYVTDRWGSHALEPQSGVAVYERGSDGLLAAARIYDDIDPPL